MTRERMHRCALDAELRAPDRERKFRVAGVHVVRTVLVLIVIACGSNDSRSSIRYPVTRTVAVVDEYHGTKVDDPYRWLEHVDSADVREWARAQSTFTDQQRGSDTLRRTLIERMRELGAGWDSLEADSDVRRGGAYEFTLDAVDSAKFPALMVRDARSGKRVLMNPRKFGAEVSVKDIIIAPDARHVAVQLSDGGNEWTTTRVARTMDARDIGDSLSGMLWQKLIWSADGRGFFYVHQFAPGPNDGFALRGPSVRYHLLNTRQADDQVLFRTPEQGVELVLEMQLTDDQRYLIISEGTGAHWEDFSWVLSRMHALDLGNGKSPQLTGTPIALGGARDAGYRLIRSDGPLLQVLTDRGAPRKRLVEIDLRDPAPTHWRDIIPQGTDVLQRVIPTPRGYLGVYLDSLRPVVRAFDRDGKLVRAFPQHPLSSVTEISAEANGDRVRVGVSTAWDVLVRTEYDVRTGDSTLLRRIVGVPSTAYDARRVWYSAKDSTRIPMLLVHRRGLVMDGSHPVFMLAYGASGTSMLPSYAENIAAWVEMGGVFAVPNVRGGGELGRAWYEAATLSRKQTTFDDVIAAAEFLIAKKYTSRERIAINGTSNGGQLVAAVMTQRPELFAAAIAEVPLTDVIHFDRGRHRAQFGWSGNAEQFPFLYAYSPLHRVKAGTCYPATLVTTSMNDNRSPPWHAFKFAAALQAAQSCDHPVLLRTHDIGGHFGARGGDSFLEDRAEILAFAARHTGLIRE